MLLERFGVTVDWRGADINSLTHLAREADRLGYGHFWVPEAWGLEAFSTAAHLIGATSKIRIGTGVVNVFSRSAATIGMGCATLNQLAPRRFMLGLGISGRGLVEYWHGIKFENGLERTREYVEVIRKIIRGEVVRYEGNLLKLDRFRLFTSAPSSAIEIFIGAMGEKNIELSKEIADGAIVTLYPISKLDSCARSLNQNRIGKKLFAYLPLRVANSKIELVSARRELSKYVAFYVASMGKYYAKNLSKLGFGEEVRKIRESASSKGNREAASNVESGFLDEICLMGLPVEILNRLSNLSPDVFPVFGVSAKSQEEANESAKWLREIAECLA